MPAYDIEVRNRDRQVVRVDEDRFLLAALESAGLRLPVGCRFGACLTCAASLIEGAVDQSSGRSFALRAHQQAAGYVLLCVSRPRADCVLDVGTRRSLYTNPFRQGARARGGDSGRETEPTGPADRTERRETGSTRAATSC